MLVSVVLFPANEVADVTGAANVTSPCLVGPHHGVIKTNREEHRPVILTPLLFESSLDLLLNPGAFDGALLKNEEQLVVDADGLVNARSELVADLQILRGKPATHVLSLEVSV